MVWQMTSRSESDDAKWRALKTGFRNSSVALRRMGKIYLAPWVFPAVFVVDGFIISLARLFPLRASARRVVFVRTDNLGDFVLWMPAAKAIRARWPWPGCQF